MAVYKRGYRPYEGALTPERSRFLVLPRYAFREVFESRVFTAFLVLCLLPFLVEAAAVYISNSAPARAILRIPERADAMRPEFFVGTLLLQGMLAFLLTAWLAPHLLSPDLVNGALPLYLSHPLSRAEYVLGKATVLAALLSLITWVPGLTLFILQAGLAGRGWLSSNLYLAWATFLGSWIWITALTLLGLAVSAWIKWRLLASAALFGVFFMGSAFGELWQSVLGSPWGRLANPFYLTGIIWRDLFALEAPVMAELYQDLYLNDVSVGAAWMGMLAVCALCLWLLDRRLRACEVVR